MKTRLLILLIMVFTLNACEDVLDVTPNKIKEADLWTEESLVRAYMNASYASTFQQGLYRNTQIGAATDEIHSIKNAGNYYIIQQGDLTPDNVNDLNGYLNNWKNAYAVIRDVNVFLEKIDEVPVLNEDKDEMRGEMKFIRAFQYAELIRRYGGVPIIDKIYGLDDDFSVERASYEECVAFIISELDEVIGLLPDQQVDQNLGKASADAARALKSRVLLYAASPLNNPENDLTKWQLAADAAEALIDTRYGLHGDYHDLFLHHNQEIIFARYFTQANTYELHFQVARNGDNGWGSDSPTQNLVNDYEMANGKSPFLDNGEINPDSGYDPNNPYENRDPRFYASILHDGSMWMGRETESFEGGMDSGGGPIAAWNTSKTRYFLKKFVPEDIPPTGSTVMPTSPWIVFRYAEILLNYAEAKYMLGDEPTAREYLNIVRSREGVNMPDVTASGEELLEKIRNERRIELVFEGHRYFDVRRWEIADETESEDLMGVIIEKVDEDTKTYTYQTLIDRTWDDRLYRLPIPRAEIDRSRNSLDQNPGYN